ncbi:dihydroorotate dehydrogenase electron transfer subunit [Enterococcus cecorum]|uniref:dihydroorotate dehydrogenase electron transfer subunit n=1 Tax=Enterococcus cecorum TaxID=44008 RepID=UPI0022CF4794|nr:dihydroorotate dehydrogenase electron transfer subunit [Enterococcus cecorum]CAI3442171.1 dihydroorotate dehydrogenase electron transfer subunit [Enterococcus cecorum]
MKQELMTVVSNHQLAPKIFELVLTGQLVKQMHHPGQFLHLRVPQADLLLRRPISINQINQEKQTVTLIYRVQGQGTQVFSQLQAGDQLDCMGPLGNGFSLDGVHAGDEVYIIGGGIGIPPLYELSKRLIEKGVRPMHFLGYANDEVSYYIEEFQALGRTLIATDDGSLGFKGNVGQLLDDYLSKNTEMPKAVFTCGNNGMLKKVESLFYQKVADVQLSLESRMACGMGACYACVCHKKDDPTKQTSVKVCDEGPIFQAGTVIY